MNTKMLLLTAIVAGLTIGCVGTGGGVGPTPSSTPQTAPNAAPATAPPIKVTGHDTALDPTSKPEVIPGECLTYRSTTERVPISLEAMGNTSASVVHGVIADLGAAQWNTPEGGAPSRPNIDAGHVMRLARVEVIEAFSGDLPSTLVAIPGGTVGCNTFVTDLVPTDLKVGAEVLLFTGSGKVSRGDQSTAVPVIEIWPVVDDSVSVPGWGASVALAAVAAAVK